MKVNLLGFKHLDYKKKETGARVQGTMIYMCYKDNADDEIYGQKTAGKFIPLTTSEKFDFPDLLKNQMVDVSLDFRGDVVYMEPVKLPPELIN